MAGDQISPDGLFTFFWPSNKLEIKKKKKGVISIALSSSVLVC